MQRQIVAMGGGGFMMEPENSLFDDFVLQLARGSRYLGPKENGDRP